MTKTKLRKTIFSIGLIPILASPLVLSSCFNTHQTQFPPKLITFNDGIGIPGVTALPEKQPSLKFISGGYLLENVFENQAVPSDPFPGEGESIKKWEDYQKFVSTQFLNSILVGSGTNIDGAYTTAQLLRALLMNDTMLFNDTSFNSSTPEIKRNWKNFLVLLANNLNQSSGTFANSSDQYLFDLNNIDLSVQALGKPTIPFTGTLNGLTKGANLASLYQTEINLTITGFSFSWFDFNGNPKTAPSRNSSQSKTLEKQGYQFSSDDKAVVESFEINFKTPLKITFTQYAYSKTAWEDVNTTFPKPLLGNLPMDEENKEIISSDVGVFKGLKLNDKEITNELNIKMTDSANSGQNNLTNSKPIQAAQSLNILFDNLFGISVYDEKSPVTSIFTVPTPKLIEPSK